MSPQLKAAMFALPFVALAILMYTLTRILLATSEAPEECPSFSMRSRDAQLDAAYRAGYSAASDRAQTLQLDHAVNACTRELMECRHPGGTP